MDKHTLPPYFMGIDIGTYESKGVLIDANCTIVATHTQAHGMENPEPNYFEHDAQAVWWGDFCCISRALLEKSGVRNTDIAAVGASTLGACLVAVDEECTPLRKAILYGIDARADKEIAHLQEQFTAEEIITFNGRPLCSNDIPPKILWLKNNEPKVWAKAHKFITGSTYITAKLTGEYRIDRFLAYGAFTPIYDPQNGEIDDRYCHLFCRPEQMATVCDTTDIAGAVTKQAAQETGLAVGTTVIAGADDSAAESISIGILEAGDMMVQLGSTMYLIALTKKLVRDSRIWSGGFIIPGMSSVQGGTNTSGSMTKWYRDNLFGELYQAEQNGGQNAYDAMLLGLEDIPAGSEGLITLPYFAGERTPINDPHASSMIFGLQLKHTKDHMYRSALESVGYSLQQHLRIFEENGADIGRVCAVGGGTKSPPWVQIICDIIAKPIVVPKVGIGACYGDAMMAAIGVNHLRDFADIRRFVSPGTVYTPNMENHATYRRLQPIFEKLYRSNKAHMHALRELL